MPYTSTFCILLVFAFLLGSARSDGATTNSSAAVVHCSKSYNDCNKQIAGSVCWFSKEVCICKVGFRRVTNNTCAKILCYSNADCDPHLYQPTILDHQAALDSVCDLVHNQCVCLKGYSESSEGVCTYGNHFDWTIIAVNAGLCLAFSTVVLAIFCFCLWCVFDEPLNKCHKCANCLHGKRGQPPKSDAGPTLKGMMTAKSFAGVAASHRRRSDGSARRPQKVILKSSTSLKVKKKESSRTRSQLKKSKSNNSAKL